MRYIENFNSHTQAKEGLGGAVYITPFYFIIQAFTNVGLQPHSSTPNLSSLFPHLTLTCQIPTGGNSAPKLPPPWPLPLIGCCRQLPQLS